MAGTLLTVYTDQLQHQRKGVVQISITDFDVETVSEIAAGSIIEIAGAMILFESDESMGVNWAAMAAGIVWARIDGVALTSAYTQVAPTWNDELQGWYDATGQYRYYARLYKSAGSAYQRKALYTPVRGVMTMYDQSAVDGIDIRGVADADKRIWFASDAYMDWDESEDEYVFPKKLNVGEITGQLTANVKLRSSYITTNPSRNGIYNALNAWIPNINDAIVISGIFYSGSNLITYVKAVRTGATQVTLYGTYSSGNTTLVCDSGGSALSGEISIAW
jgi:hypothetical protein